MTDESPNSQAAPEGEAWKEVGQQFSAIGQSLAAAFQAAWKNEEVRRQAQEMKTGLEALVKEVGHAIQDTADSPEVKQAADDAVRAGKQAAHEVRPHLLEALRAVNRELQTLIDRMETAARDRETGEKP